MKAIKRLFSVLLPKRTPEQIRRRQKIRALHWYLANPHMHKVKLPNWSSGMSEKIGRLVSEAEKMELDGDLSAIIDKASWQAVGSSELVQVQILKELKKMNKHLESMQQLLQEPI